MTYLAKPKVHHPSLPRNALGYTRRDYEGAISTLCGSTSSSKKAWMIAEEIESWPQPAQSVEIAPS